MGTADFQTHFLQNPGNAVAHSGGRRQAQIHNAEGHAQPFGGFHAHQLAHTGDLEGGFLNGLSHHIKGLALHPLQGMVDNTGAGNAHVDDALRLAHTALAKTTTLAQPRPSSS